MITERKARRMASPSHGNRPRRKSPAGWPYLLWYFLLVCTVSIQADFVHERWAGKNVPCTHLGTLRIIHAQSAQRLVFDLSAIPADARIHHASIYCTTNQNRQPADSPRLFVVEALKPDGHLSRGAKPLQLESPWYRSFEVTEAVKRWVGKPKVNFGVAVEAFEGLIAPQTRLEVLYEGHPRNLPEQVTGIRAVHHGGQTFITWTEHESYLPNAVETIWIEKFAENGDTLAEGRGDGAYDMPNHPGITLKTLRRLQGLAVRDKASGFQGIKGLRRTRSVPPVTYRIYRHNQKITSQNIHHAERLAEVQPLSGFDPDVYKIHFRGEFLNQREEPSSVIPTYRKGNGEPVIPGEGLYVHTTPKEGAVYYAVTVALAGTENLSDISSSNSLPDPVMEKPGTPEPVLQWIQEDRYHKDVPEHWYRFWASPPLCNLPGRSFRIGVSVPPKFKAPGPLIISSISGRFNLRNTIRLPSRSAVTLVVQRQLDWLPALFYNEGRGTLRGLTGCKVDYFSERYMLSIINWLMRNYEIDRSRIEGSLMHFGLRHPEIFKRMQMGRYTAGYDLRFAPGGPSMPSVLGPKGIRTVRGEDAWKMYSVSEYVNAHPNRDIPYLVCISGTGKDSGHTSEFGWQDDPRGWAGLLRARMPFVASWSSHPPGELMRGLGRMRWDVTIPAFSSCSLDNNPGNGDPGDGDYYGCINGWLLWNDKDTVDKKDRWEMTVRVVSSCPEGECTVDITPRRCVNFKPQKGRKFRWMNTSLSENEIIQSGEVTADEWGLVTVKTVKVTKGKNRVVIYAQELE